MRNAPHGYELIDPYYRHINRTLDLINTSKPENSVNEEVKDMHNKDKDTFQDLLTKHITLDQRLTEEELAQLEEIVSNNDSQVLKILLDQVKRRSLGAH